MSLPRLLTVSSFFLFLASCHPRPGSSQLEEIDNGLRLSLHFIANQNSAVYASLEQKQTDPTTRDLSNRWSPIAFKVRMLSARAAGFVDSIRTKMTTIGSISQKDKKDLFDTLVSCRRDLLHIFPDSLDPYRQFLAEDREVFRRYIPLLYDTSTHGSPGIDFAEWSDRLFRGDTSMIVLGLDKLKIDILLSEQEIVKYCDKQIMSNSDRFEIFEPLVALNSNIVAPGDSLEMSAGIGAYYSWARVKVTIAGVSVPTHSGGLALYNFRAPKRPGRYSIPVRIEYTMPWGGGSTLERDVYYRVK